MVGLGWRPSRIGFEVRVDRRCGCSRHTAALEARRGSGPLGAGGTASGDRPCIFRLGSSVGGLIPCINSFFTFDAALLTSIRTKSFGNPSPLGRRTPKPPTFEHVSITRARASRAGPAISKHVAQTIAHACAEGRPSPSTTRPHSRASRPEPHKAARQLGAAWLGSSRHSHKLRAGRAAHEV